MHGVAHNAPRTALVVAAERRTMITALQHVNTVKTVPAKKILRADVETQEDQNYL